MTTTITELTEFVGTPPYKATQSQPVFDAAAQNWTEWQDVTFVPELNDLVTQINTVGSEITDLADDAESSSNAASVFASEASASTATALTYSNTSIAAAASAAETQAVVNGILGLGIGTAYTDAEGNLLMPYDDGVLATAPYLDSEGNLIIEVTVA
jgi:hypothetical protein